MKNHKILFSVLFLLFGFNQFSIAQWQTTGNDIYYETGNVGIGDPDDLIFPFNVSKSISETTGDNQQISKCNLGYIINSNDEKNGQGSLLRFRVGSNMGFDAAIGAIGTGNDMGRFSLFVDDNAVSGSNNWNEAMSINYNGNIGINKIDPSTKLDVFGDIKISDENSGLILTSPDGTEWKLTVDNGGNLSVDQSTKVNKIKSNNNIIIFPNPSNDFIKISLNSNDINSYDIELYSIQGKLLYMKNYDIDNVKVDLTGFSDGIFVLKIKDESGNLLKTEKIIKQ